MGIFSKLFKKDSVDKDNVRSVEDFMSLIRVYFQSVVATNMGITNIRMLPDIANFKRIFRVPTQGGRLGLAEKTASKKIMMQDYGLTEEFFKEIDSSIRRNCKNQNQVQSYFSLFQGFSNSLMMLMGSLMQWKFRLPSFMKGALKGMTQKTIHDICTKTYWKKEDVHKEAMTVKQYKEKLGFSEDWMSQFSYILITLAKKEAKKSKKEKDEKK